MLTLASSVTVDVQADYAQITAGGASGDRIVNQGVIDQTGSGTLAIYGNAFTNSGTIDAKATGGHTHHRSDDLHQQRHDRRRQRRDGL